VGFLILALQYRFRVPRYDYWDIAYESTFVFHDGNTPIIGFFAYLLSPVADQIMVLPRVIVLTSNHLAGQYFIEAEIIFAWILLVIGYLLLLSIFGITFSSWREQCDEKRLKTLIVFAFYWWPASLPSLTNNWFAIQYSIILATGLASIYFFQRSEENIPRWVMGYVCFLLCALSHGTGVLLGPALSIWLWFRYPRLRATITLLTLIIPVCLILVWQLTIPDRISAHNILWSANSLKFLIRIGTPFFWEQPIFLLFILPLLTFVSWRGTRSPLTDLGKESTVLMSWTLIVWGATFIARYKFQDHANPHYLRFFTLLYISMLIASSKWAMWKMRKYQKVLVSAFIVIVWAKGAESGLGLTRDYFLENRSGYQSLIENIGSENKSTEKVYPLNNLRLTTLLIPKLISHNYYGYGALLEKDMAQSRPSVFE